MAWTIKPEWLSKWVPSGWLFSTTLPSGEVWNSPNPLQNSFRQAVAQIVLWRKNNAVIAAKLKLSADPEVVTQELIDFTVARLLKIKGGTSYLVDTDAQSVQADTLKKNKTSLWAYVGNVKRAVVAGEETLREWLGNGGKPVEHALAESRALVCSTCPKNTKSHWSLFFFGKPAEAIKKVVEFKQGMKLETSLDDKLGACEACLCPLETKIHVPLPHILEHMDEATKRKLDPRCWITK